MGVARRSVFAALLRGLPFVVASGCGSDSALAPSATPAPSGNVRASLSAVDFGDVSCGDAIDTSLTLENSWASDEIAFTAVAEPAELFEVIDNAGMLPPQRTTPIRLRARVTGAPAGVPLGGVLHVRLAAPRAGELYIPLRVTPHGATLELLGGTGIDFGVMPLAAPAALLPVALRNSGDRDVDVAFSIVGSPSFVAATPSPVTVHTRGDASVTMSFRPRAAGTETGALQVTTTGPVCSAIPSRVPLAGTATSGALGIAPGSIDFGDSPCGSAGGDRTLTLTNYGAAPASWEGHVLEPDLFALTSAATGALATDASVNLGLTALATDMTAGPMTGHLVISTADQSLTVPISRSKLGGDIQFVGAAPASFGRVKVGTSDTLDVHIRNRGSAPVTFNPKLVSATEMVLPNSTPITVMPGAGVAVTVRYTPTRLPVEEVDTLRVETTDVLCTPAPWSSVHGVPFARATAAWGDSSLLLDDGVRFVGPLAEVSLTVALPSDATPLMRAMGRGACYTQPGVSGLTCWGLRHSGAPEPELLPYLDGVLDLPVIPSQLGYDTGRLADGSLLSMPSRSPLPAPTGIAALRGFDGLECAIRQIGTVACWGGGSAMTGTFGVDVVVPSNPYEVPGLDDAVDMTMGPLGNRTEIDLNGGSGRSRGATRRRS